MESYWVAQEGLEINKLKNHVLNCLPLSPE